MATPRKRKRPENESQDIDETYLDQDIEASQANSNAGGSGQIDASQFSGSPKRSHHGLGGVSSQIQLTPKKKMKLLNDNSNDETAHQYQTSLPVRIGNVSGTKKARLFSTGKRKRLLCDHDVSLTSDSHYWSFSPFKLRIHNFTYQSLYFDFHPCSFNHFAQITLLTFL